jgi:hypothetical protein
VTAESVQEIDIGWTSGFQFLVKAGLEADGCGSFLYKEYGDGERPVSYMTIELEGDVSCIKLPD